MLYASSRFSNMTSSYPAERDFLLLSLSRVLLTPGALQQYGGIICKMDPTMRLQKSGTIQRDWTIAFQIHKFPAVNLHRLALLDAFGWWQYHRIAACKEDPLGPLVLGPLGWFPELYSVQQVACRKDQAFCGPLRYPVPSLEAPSGSANGSPPGCRGSGVKTV